MTQNVVTYTVEIVTDNSNGRLLPYLTANVQFELNRSSDVLRAPNAALRWKPSPEQVSPEFRETFENSTLGKKGQKGGKGLGSGSARSAVGNGSPGVVWLLEGQYVRPLHVRAGVTDGVMTEVQGKGLTENLQVVTGVQTRIVNRTDGSNPFAPQFLRGRRDAASR
jgi:HlyD family secretion protein